MNLRRRAALGVSTLLLVSLASGALRADSDWPQWRGPTGNGVSPDGTPPIEWGPGKNLRWKVELPGTGDASPVVWRNRVFVVAAITADAPAAGGSAGSGAEDEERGRAGEQDRNAQDRGRRGRRGRGRRRGPPDRPVRFETICIDRSSGAIRWRRTAVESTPHEGHHPDHGYASASPITDGERVYAHFGSRGLFCFDLDGKPLWKKTDFGRMRTRGSFGEGSTPTLYGDTLIVPWDHEGDSALFAIDCKTGDTRWRIDRDEPSCWATPLVVRHGDTTQVLASGDHFARGYDLATGKELWRCAGQTSRPVASPVAGHGLVVIGSGYRGSYMGAFRLDARGDLGGTAGVAWELSRYTPDVPSPVLSGRRLYFLSGRSDILSCHDVVTGKPFYSARRVEGLRNVYASPVAANGHVFLTGRDGTTVVIEDADELKIVATNRVGEPVDATPAIAGREIFVRGNRHLFCFAAPATGG